MCDVEVWLIDACALLPGLSVLHFMEVRDAAGESVDYFHAIIEDTLGKVYEFDMAGWFADLDDEELALDDFTTRLRETCGLQDAP